jgi:hypothetical protein
MPTSRKRPRKTRKPRQIRRAPQRSYRDRDAGEVLEESRPWIEAMLAVDEAERRGDAEGALRLMRSRMLGPDGDRFWRPWRINRVLQVTTLGEALPAWGVSRWIVAQAHEVLGTLGMAADPRRGRCEELTLEIRGGLDGLSTHGEMDARCKLMDHDWVYRQLFLYELGGLRDFVVRSATPELLAGADHIHDWTKAPMTALRLVERAPGTVTWEYVETGEPLELPNIGSATMVVPGEHVLGRLVPTEAGVMLESAPLVVPQRTARRVADDPGSWTDAVAAAREDIETAGFEHGLVSDVRQLIWQLGLHDFRQPLPEASELDAHFARRALATARACLDVRSVWQPDDLDPWGCLRAALLEPGVVMRVPAVGGSGDIEVFERLSHLLAPPADVVCRDLMDELVTRAVS